MPLGIHCENMGVPCTEECCAFFTICSFTTNLKVQVPFWHVIERRFQGQCHPVVVYMLSSVFYTLSSASSFIAFSPVNNVIFTCKVIRKRRQEVRTGGLLVFAVQTFVFLRLAKVEWVVNYGQGELVLRVFIMREVLGTTARKGKLKK